MDDLALIQSMLDLGVDVQSVRALATIALVEVAWADGSLSAAERERVIRLSEQHFNLDEDGVLLLADWLTYAPSPAYCEKAYQVLISLAAREKYGISRAFLQAIPTYADQVAQASGGFLGLFRVSRAEKSALDRIKQKFSEIDRQVLSQSQEATNLHARVTIFSDDVEDTDETVFVGVIITGEGEQRQKHRCPESGLVLGSGERADVRLQGAGISAEHARIELRHRRFYLKDLPGTSGTFVHGQRIGHRRLLGGETIQIGSEKVIFKMAKRT